MQPRPIYKVGDKVAHCCQRTGLNYFGTITEVILPGQIEESKFNEVQLKWYAERDKDYLNNPIYIVRPDSSPGPMTFCEAKALRFVKDKENYLKAFETRIYHCLEADLVAAEDIKNFGTIHEVNAMASNPEDLLKMLTRICYELSIGLALHNTPKHYRAETAIGYSTTRKLFPLETKS